MIQPADIRNKQFTTTRFHEGYDQDEVDHFLDALTADYTSALTKAQTLQERLDVAQAAQGGAAAADTVALPPVPSDPPASAFGGMQLLLAKAEETARQLVAEAEQAAATTAATAKVQVDALLAQAKADADQLGAAAIVEAGRLKADAAAEVERLKADATGEAARVVAELNSRKTDLEGKVAELVQRHGSIWGALKDAVEKLDPSLFGGAPQ